MLAIMMWALWVLGNKIFNKALYKINYSTFTKMYLKNQLYPTLHIMTLSLIFCTYIAYFRNDENYTTKNQH
jgi:hypothetical protein